MVRDLKWTIKESKQLLKDKWTDVRADVCIKPDGSIIEPFYVYGFPDYATAVAITKNGEVILERIYRHGLNIIATELPGGCIDKTDASLEDAIARELLEETAYSFDNIEYLGKISPNPATNNNLMHMFLATGGVFNPYQPLDIDEDVEVFLVSLDEFIDMVQKQQFIQSMQLSTIFFALQKLERITVK
jgi:ADP-ribose pyrophosphatase